MRKFTTATALLAGVALIAAGCGDDDSASGATTTKAGATTVKPAGGGVKCSGIALGFLGALTGDAGALGQNMVDGAQLKVDEFNKANPDCKIEIKKFDSQGAPDKATPLADSIVQDKSIVALIGPGFSGETKATMPKFEAATLPMITPGATNAKLQTNGWKTFHRILANDDKQAPGVVKLLKSKGAKAVGVIDDGSEYGKGLADTVRKELGALATSSDAIDPKAADYGAAVNKMKAANVDYVFYGGYYAEAAKLVKQLRAAGVKAVFVAGDGVLDEAFIKNAGSDAEGSLLTATGLPPDATPKAFADAYQAAYKKTPALYSPEAYDVATVFLDAIAAGKVTRADINTFISTYDKPGITKQLKFLPDGEIAGDAVYFTAVEGGKLVGKGIIK
ncbi:MAG: branched-chain amino acid ABC transporter substrate-binding protein [Acidimicrobiales bacterium]